MADTVRMFTGQLASRWPRQGIMTGAKTAARSITDRKSQAIALAGVAAALAQAGQYQRAETVARSITDSNSQATALTDVAAALAQAVRPLLGRDAAGTRARGGAGRRCQHRPLPA